MQKLRKLNLSEFPAFTPPPEQTRQDELELDEGLFFTRQSQKVACRANSPARFLQFLFFAFFHLLTQLVISLKSPLTRLNYSFRGALRLFGEDLEDNNSVWIDPVHDSPSDVFIDDLELVAPAPNRGHWSRVWQTELFSLLDLPQQEARLKPRGQRKGRRFDLAFEPDERLVPRGHQLEYMSHMTYCQARIGPLPNSPLLPTARGSILEE